MEPSGDVELNDLSNPFEELPTVTALDGKIGSESFDPSPNEEENLIRGDKQNKKSTETKIPSCFSIQYYQPYFDVDTKTEMTRLLRSLKPWDRPFFRDEEEDKPAEKPDLYGPFWIATTLAFLMAALGNFGRFISDEKEAQDSWHSDVEKISNAAWGLYLALIIVPVLLYGLISYSDVPASEAPGVIKLISLYGYSLFPYVPACVLCVIPVGWLRWSAIILAFIQSTLLLVFNVYVGELKATKKKGLPLLGVVILCQGGLALLMKFYFFSF